jgi:hypothetical protein
VKHLKDEFRGCTKALLLGFIVYNIISFYIGVTSDMLMQSASRDGPTLSFWGNVAWCLGISTSIWILIFVVRPLFKDLIDHIRRR